jgi:hypothetical protein
MDNVIQPSLQAIEPNNCTFSLSAAANQAIIGEYPAPIVLGCCEASAVVLGAPPSGC